MARALQWAAATMFDRDQSSPPFASRMRCAAIRLPPIASAAFLAAVTGCALPQANEEFEPVPCGKCDDFGDDAISAAVLTPVGSRHVLLPNGGSERLVVEYLNRDDALTTGEVTFALRGPDGGAHLSTSVVTTDDDGLAQVTVTAGSQGRTGFEVVATAPGANEVTWRVAVSGGDLSSDVAPQPDFSTAPHAPIRIDGDADFTAANGVRNPEAAGTSLDPYVIERWHVEPTAATPCFEIRNTSRHFVLRENDCSSAQLGVLLAAVDNAVLDRNLVAELAGEHGGTPGADGGDAYGLVMNDVSNVTVTDSDFAHIYGGAGEIDGGDGGTAYGIYVSGATSNVLIQDSRFRMLSGGAGGAGSLGWGVGADGGAGGRGGDSRPIHLGDDSRDVTIRGSDFAFVYGGAGGAGAVGTIGLGLIRGGDGGTGGAGGTAEAITVRGDHIRLSVRNNRFAFIYGGAGAVGGVGAMYDGLSGHAGAGGAGRGIRGEGRLSDVTAADNHFELIYGGAGGAGSVGPLNGSPGSNGGAGADAAAVDIAGAERGTFTDNRARWIYGAAGGAGAVGAFGPITGGAGGNGGSGGSAFGLLFTMSRSVTVRGNDVALVFGGAGAAGAWGGSGSFGGNGGHGGAGGHAAGVRFEASSELSARDNQLSYIAGAPGAMGAMGGFGVQLVATGGDGGHGGDGAGLHYLGCAGIASAGNVYRFVTAGLGGWGGLIGGASGSSGRAGGELITQ